jgi:hypothetical protein
MPPKLADLYVRPILEICIVASDIMLPAALRQRVLSSLFETDFDFDYDDDGGFV